MIVRAVAGSGKSTALREYARARPKQRVLYVTFNRSVRENQTRAYERAGLQHVDVRTLGSIVFCATWDVHHGCIENDFCVLPELVENDRDLADQVYATRAPRATKNSARSRLGQPRFVPRDDEQSVSRLPSACPALPPAARMLSWRAKNCSEQYSGSSDHFL